MADDLTIEEFRENIRKNLTGLKLYIDPKLVVDALVQGKVLTPLQSPQIAAEKMDFDKNGLLLDFLCTRPNKDIPIILKCFRNANQDHMADIMSGQAVKETSGGLQIDVATVEENSISQDLYNEEEVYKWNRDGRRGLALIISNLKFDGERDRYGTEVDCTNMKSLLQMLGYDPLVKQDRTASEIKHDIQEFAESSKHKEADSAIVVIMSHGNEGVVYGAKSGGTVYLNELFESLDGKLCPHLIGKPKLFFIQACRGGKKDCGFTVKADGAAAGGANPLLIKVSSGGDFLVSFSTTPGYVAYRHEEKGSFYIQSICRIFAKHAKDKDIFRLVTMVHRDVRQFEVLTDEYGNLLEPQDRKVQTPLFQSTLDKEFYLLPIKYS